MKIGILQADSVLPQFQDIHGDYPDMIMDRLEDNSETEIEFEIYDVEHGHYPDAIDDCDGYVITGSKKSVYDDEHWIETLGQYVQDLYVVKKPLIGICFGHQLVAQALGGRTQASEKGWGVGVHRSHVIKPQDFMQPHLDDINVLVSHKDQVSMLPMNAELIASSEFCPNSMYQIGGHIFCLQGHPEFVPNYSSDLMDMREEILGPEVHQAGKNSLSKPLDSDVIAKWILTFLEQAKSRYAAAAL